MGAYYLRSTANAAADLERGYSFVGYLLSDTREEAIAEHSLLDPCWREWKEEYVKQDNATGMWGMAHSGLCGWGGFDTIEEALAIVDEVRDRYAGTLYVWEGNGVYDADMDGMDDGNYFLPIRIVMEVK